MQDFNSRGFLCNRRLELDKTDKKSFRESRIKVTGFILAIGYAIVVTAFVSFFYLLEAITLRIALFDWAWLMIPFLYCMYQTYQNRRNE